MNFIKLLSLLFILSFSAGFSQENSKMKYEATKDFPYGKYNPTAPEQLKDFQNLIGVCNCKSETRNKDKTWAKPVNMTWKWKYIMNGTAIQDETLKEDGRHSGSIRQYDKDSMRWNVHYYSSSSTPKTLPVWNGNKNKENKIVLYREQKAPNGIDGFYRLTFYDISTKGYKWVGEWVTKSENFAYATWRISCVKRED